MLLHKVYFSFAQTHFFQRHQAELSPFPYIILYFLPLNCSFHQHLFTGHCQKPCKHGGLCTGLNKCNCKTGYTGDQCEKGISCLPWNGFYVLHHAQKM